MGSPLNSPASTAPSLQNMCPGASSLWAGEGPTPDGVSEPGIPSLSRRWGAWRLAKGEWPFQRVPGRGLQALLGQG